MEKFLNFLRFNGLTKTQVADYLGVSKQYISQVSSGATFLSDEKIAKLKENKDWDTSMFPEVSSKLNKPARDSSRLKLIPLLPFSAIAGYMSYNNGVDLFRGETVSFSDFTDRGADCAIRVDGDSMYPRYKSGDILAIKILKDPTFFQWGRTYCLSTTQGCIIKKLFPCPGDNDRIVCHSENNELFPDYTITKSDILAVAIVVGHAGIE